jgi:3-hydroxybutyryl-CoA dehydratase
MNEKATLSGYPSQYKLNDIEVGLKKTFNVYVSESMINEFAKLTGDCSPLHMDEEYARTTDFGTRICHGMLLGSFLSRLVGIYLPGKYGLCLSYSVRHLLPCFPNQEITVEGQVVEKSNSTRIITIRATIKNSSGKLVSDALLKVLVRE